MGAPGPVHLDIQSLAEGVHHTCTNPVKTSRGSIRSATELAARVQLGHHELDAGEPGLGVDIDRDAPAVVGHHHRAVGGQDDLDFGAVSGQRLVHGVVDDLPQAVHQPAAIGGADVHARTLANSVEALEDREILDRVARFGCSGRGHRKNLTGDLRQVGVRHGR